MIDTAVDDPLVADPTYMADIRLFFRPDDISHMAAKGIDLGSYNGVKRNALAIYAHTAPTGDMPPDPAFKWSVNRRQTFLNWIIKKYPMGVATPQAKLSGSVSLTSPSRTRKNVHNLTNDEIQTLKKAFRGLMERDPAQDDSYFAIASIHGLPQAWCSHHIDQYNPWHRVYLKTFEDALRSIPGCEDVTLPFWDISEPIPSLLSEEPFAQYALPVDPGLAAQPPQPGMYFPYTTERNDAATIKKLLAGYDVLGEIGTSDTQTEWGQYNDNGYQKFSIQAHDGGHLSVGPTMAAQEVAAFDPAFWFFHCNLDRLWLQWQTKVQALTLAGFKTTITGDVSWLDAPLNTLPPFSTTSDQSIDLGIAYEQDAAESVVAFENLAGHMEAGRRFRISKAAPISVRVKGIARLNIPGSFVVNLLADGKPIAKRAFFQPNAPRSCPTCALKALVNIDFRIDQKKIVDRELSVTIEVPSQTEMGTLFPLSEAGNPTINARFLLTDH
ncbi:tyrosinase family protein [Rhizobium ruizarguesonis]|uniref:tyrosinase family protein n=1 Tax=Rhizobium ruizarguesonis TaxID=2081791 RepID=UPI001031CC02|nr:tyrosinase family protein [Rhizobium ruizarguesonis]TBA52722.1 tyrosinase family protein [Rhizobium ruizarguesonis]